MTITFIDSIGRTILGEQVSITDTILSVKNPAMINLVQAQNNQMQIQIIPLFFAEFIDPSVQSKGSTWKFNLSQVTLSDVTLNSQLLAQYSRVFNPQPPQSAPAAAPVIKLFDDEEKK